MLFSNLHPAERVRRNLELLKFVFQFDMSQPKFQIAKMEFETASHENLYKLLAAATFLDYSIGEFSSLLQGYGAEIHLPLSSEFKPVMRSSVNVLDLFRTYHGKNPLSEVVKFAAPPIQFRNPLSALEMKNPQDLGYYEQGLERGDFYEMPFPVYGGLRIEKIPQQLALMDWFANVLQWKHDATLSETGQEPKVSDALVEGKFARFMRKFLPEKSSVAITT